MKTEPRAARRRSTKVITCASVTATLLAGPFVLPAAAGPVSQAAPATASCEFPTWQYAANRSGTIRQVAGGQVTGSYSPGDLLNTGMAPSTTGWLTGNFYTPAGQFTGSGAALRDSFNYVRNCC